MSISSSLVCAKLIYPEITVNEKHIDERYRRYYRRSKLAFCISYPLFEEKIGEREVGEKKKSRRGIQRGRLNYMNDWFNI